MSSLFNFDLVAEEGWELLNKYDYGTNMKEIPKVVNKRVKEMPTSKILSFIMFDNFSLFYVINPLLLIVP